MDKKVYKQCQSCGMPLKMDPAGGGSERDGTKNPMYCSSCYRDGAFISPEMTVTEMQELVDRVLRDEVKTNRIFRWIAVSQIPRLKRWRPG